MRPMDDVWNDISSLPSPATTTHFQNFFAPALRPPSPATTTISFHPPPSPTTMLTLLTTTHSDHQDPNKRLKPNPPPPPPPRIFTAPTASPPEYTEKFRRLMKNRESAARSRARKQARADELEHEVMRLAKENAKLKRLQKEVKIIIFYYF
ncbi:putative transcription factor bZIP family [Helianthus debilis subsp. tardiflorus]